MRWLCNNICRLLCLYPTVFLSICVFLLVSASLTLPLRSHQSLGAWAPSTGLSEALGPLGMCFEQEAVHVLIHSLVPGCFACMCLLVLCVKQFKCSSVTWGLLCETLWMCTRHFSDKTILHLILWTCQ